MKQPNRRNNSVSQRFGSGIVTIYCQRDTAEVGYQPKPELIQKARLNYEELRLGINRYYAAMQSTSRIDRIIRVPRPPFEIATFDIAQTEDGKKYRIEMVQTADVYPASLDLTLKAIKP